MSPTYTPRPPAPRGAFTLPAWYYTDPAYFRDEMERFFGRGWFHVGREDHVPRPGDYRLLEILGESLILVRDGSGQLRCHFNVCRHRGTRLCVESSGRFGETIQCPYHAWTYRLDGQLVGAPHMEASAGFAKADYPLKQAAIDVWDGHVFINFDPAAVPLADHLLDLPEKFRAWDMGALRVGHRVIYDAKANWKLIIQNYSECLHCPTNHPVLKKVAHYLSGVNDSANSVYLGGSMDLLPEAGTMSMTGQARRRLGTLSPEQRRRVYFHAILPNLLLSPHPDYVLTHTLWPRAADRTEIVCEWHFHPDDLAAPDFDPTPEAAFWDQTNREDWRLSELTQLGLTSRAYEPGPYSGQEDLLWSFDRIIAGDPDAPRSCSSGSR